MDSILKNELNSIENQITELKKQITRKEDERAKVYTQFTVFEANKDNINLFLKNHGLKIESVRHIKLCEDMSLNVDIYLEMVGRRKPVSTYKDYDKNGNSKNAIKISNQLSILGEEFKNQFPSLSISINKFSFERPNGILGNIWVH